MTLAEIEEMAKALGPVFKNALKIALDQQKKALEADFAQHLHAVKAEFSGAVSSLKSEVLSVDAMRPALQEMVDKAVAAIPAPQDGKSVTVDDVMPQINAEIVRQVAEIPRPEDGKSVSVEDLRPVLQEMVDKVASEIPVPADGKSVTVDDVRPVLQEMVDKAAAEIPVPVDGKSVTVEDVLPQINAEIARQVAQIPRPEAAKDGRDALDIMILPDIDFAKSYPRGTFATHNGGLWKSHSQTAGERGWDCIVRGVGAVHLEQKNERNFVIVYTDTVGDKKEFPITVPSQIYRGIWRENKEYQRGDTVTWGGSLWHCNADMAVGKPGESEEHWKLAVKRSGR